MPLLNSLGSTFPIYIIPTFPFRRRSSASTTTTWLSSSSISASTSTSTSTSSSSTSTSITATATAIDTAQVITSPNKAATPSPRPFLTSHHPSLLRCTRCLAQIATTSQIISKGFTGRHGRAYLVSPASFLSHGATTTASLGAGGVGVGVGGTQQLLLPNTTIGKPQQRQLVTGLHTVCDVTCALCGSVLGWKYVAAEEEGQKYKVGKFILETKRVMRDMLWDGDYVDDHDAAGVPITGTGTGIGTTVTSTGTTTAAGAVVGKDSSIIDERIEFDSQDEEECEDLFMGIWSEKLASKRRRDKAWRMDH